MLRQLTVQIPKSQWADIKKLLDLPEKSLQELADHVSSIRPLSDVEDLTDQCVIATQLPRDAVEAVLTVVVNLSYAQHNVSEEPSQILQRAADALAASEFPEWEQKYHSAWQQRQVILERFLMPNQTIDVMAKVRELLYSFQNVFLDSTVITDVRYIYDDSATQAIGGLVLHTLGLQYFEGTQPRQAHITLSSTDVSKLISQLQRSQIKANTATIQLNKADIPELTPKRNP